MKKKVLCISMLLIIIAGCVSIPPPIPENNQSSILAISINVKQPIPVFTSCLRAVYFIKLEKDSDIINQKTIIKSNYYNKDCIYLLNAKPGRYAAIAAFEKDIPVSNNFQNSSNRDSSYNSFYFAYDIIKLSEVEVMPGEFAFMGAFTLRKPWSMSFSNADEVQLYFCRQLQPDLAVAEKENSFLKVTFGTLCGSSDYAVAVSSNELKKDLTSELDFLNNSLDHFKGAGFQKILYEKQLSGNKIWLDIINNRIEKIKKIKNFDQDKNRWITIPDDEKE